MRIQSILKPFHFGALPPMLNRPVGELWGSDLRNGEAWRDPDKQFILNPDGTVSTTLSQADLIKEMQRRLNDTARGYINVLGLFPSKLISQARAWRNILITGFKDQPVRVAKELVKKAFHDPMQHYWPFFLNGYWVHLHDIKHYEVSQLKPIQIHGHLVNGVNGINAKDVPAFHPDQSDYKAQYNGLYDELRVAIHVYLEKPKWIHGLRIRNYQLKLKLTEQELDQAISDHRKTMCTKTAPFSAKEA